LGKDREMAQALRREIAKRLLRPQRFADVTAAGRPRKLSSSAPMTVNEEAGSSAQLHEDLEEAHKWRNITIVGYVACTALGIYNFAGHHEEEEEEKKEYSYLHIRNKEFPWGPDGLFEYKHEDE
jgi:cytochrome c oxidase subunit 6a